MRRRIGVKKSTEESDVTINLTPLIDVVFVMLIMFIVVAPLLELDQVELAGGGSDAKELSSAVADASPISIHVRKDNSILLNHQKISLPELKKRLKVEKKKYPDTIPLLYHDKKAFFGTYQEVKNALVEAGFQNMDVILSP